MKPVRRPRVLAVLSGVLGLLVVAPSSASAAPLDAVTIQAIHTGDPVTIQTVSKSGGKVSCGGGGRVTIQGYGSGLLSFYAPSSSLQYTVDHGSDIYPSTWYSYATSVTSWKVSSDGGYLYDPGTYAYCRPPDAPELER